MSARDWDWMLNLLEKPPAANDKLKAAMDRYQQAKSNKVV
jgi:uncharacterized protein (DUF1778 family)